MALIEAVFAVAATATRSSLLPSSSSSLSSCLSFSTQLQRNAWSIGSITLLSKRRLSGCSERTSIADIEDLSSGGGGSGSTSSSSQRKSKLTKSLLHRFRRRKGLCVTDITATEWCEKQHEFFLLGGKRKKKTKAMKVGSVRHAALEKEVLHLALRLLFEKGLTFRSNDNFPRPTKESLNIIKVLLSNCMP